jgi:hypothetical protein
MKHILTVMVIVACIVFSNNRSMAQRTISLRNFETLKNNYRKGVDTTDNGEDITYIQDTGNELTQYVGVWKVTFSSRHYELTFAKRTAYKMDPSDDVSRDMLIGWVTVKDDNGGVIYTNTGKTEKSNGFHGDNFQSGTNFYRLDFIGSCYNDSGQAFLFINTNGTTRLSYSNQPDVKGGDCPTGFVPVLPTVAGGITLTKQP